LAVRSCVTSRAVAGRGSPASASRVVRGDQPAAGVVVVAIVQRPQVGPVVAEQPQPAVQRRQLVEIEVRGDDRVAERALVAIAARVDQVPLVQRRVHAPSSASSRAAATCPERRPSSWKPNPVHAPAK
jgi:hypothetical protein